MSFLPPGVIATFAQGTMLGRGARRKKRKTRATKRSKRSKRSKRAARRPKPGTKAWMAYIRGKRKRK